MSCGATPAHASESFEWHSAEQNNPVNCFARGRQHSAEQTIEYRLQVDLRYPPDKSKI